MRKSIFNSKAIISVLMALLLFASTFVMGYAAETKNVCKISVSGKFDYAQAHEVLKIVNKERKARGLRILKMNPMLVEAAMQRAAEVAISFSHYRPDGSYCFTAIDKTREPGIYTYGENISGGFVDAEDVMSGWMSSDGHRANILNAKYDSVGIGVFYQGDTIYWTQMFAAGTSGQKSTKKTVEKDTVKINILDDDLPFKCTAPESLAFKETGKLEVYLSGIKINASSFNYKSKKPSILTVNSKGKLKGVSFGKTTVTATLKGGKSSGKATVSVTENGYILREYNYSFFSGLYCMKDGNFTDYTGLFKNTDGKTYYVSHGEVRLSATGVVDHTDGNQYYVKKGVLNKKKTGFAKHVDTGEIYYVKKGKVDKSKTGLVKKSDKTWYYIKNGKVDKTKTGLVKYDGELYYVKKGKVNFSKTGLVKHTNGKWYYVENGKVNRSKTGLVKHTNGVWYYVRKGKIDWSKTGLVKHTNGAWYYVKKGQIDWSKTGLVKHTNGAWYYVKKGQIDWSKIGLVKHTNGVWYYVKKGQIDWSKTGLVKHTNGVWYYVEKGQINWSKTGYVKHTNGVWYYVEKGKVVR